MYSSYQLLRVQHDERLRYAETRRMIKQAATAARPSSPEPAPTSVRRRPFRLGRLVGQG